MDLTGEQLCFYLSTPWAHGGDSGARPMVDLWAQGEETMGKWNAIDKQIQKHSHKVTNQSTNECLKPGRFLYLNHVDGQVTIVMALSYHLIIICNKKQQDQIF